MILLNRYSIKRKKAISMYQNYTTGQTALTLNLDFTIPNNHLATVIGWFVDSIPEDVLLGDSAKTGRPAYHPAMMLKILLFAYSRRVFSGRKIALMLEENLPMMVLADHQQISYHTINNFRSSERIGQEMLPLLYESIRAGRSNKRRGYLHRRHENRSRCQSL